MTMWKWLMLVAVLATGEARAEEHVRGAYRFETGDVPAFVARSPIAEQWPAGTPGADDTRWRYWLYDVQIDRRGGEQAVYGEYAYEPRGASLLGDAGRFEIEFLPDTQTLVLHEVAVRRDGKWSSRLDPARISLARREDGFEQDLADGLVTAMIVLEDVRIGDVVRIAYTVRGANPVLAGQRTDWLRGGFSTPMLHARTRVLYDPGTRIATARWKTDRSPTVRTLADALEVSFEQRGIEPTVDHGDYPRGDTPRAAIHVGRQQSWSDVVRWALPLYPKVEAPLPADLEARLEEWKRLPDAPARLRAALRAVQDEVRYFGIEIGENTHRPHTPQEVWNRRFGDCKDKAYLLATLLGRMGIAAVPALVSVDDGGYVAGFVPSADVFDHVIVRAQLDGRTVWVDPTLAQQGGDPRSHDLSDLGVALPVAPGIAALERIAAPADVVSGIEVTERITVDRDGPEADLLVTTVYRGARADDTRRRNGSERLEDLSRRYADFYRRRFREVRPVGLPEMKDDRDAGTYTVVERYRLAAPFEESGGVQAIDLHADGLDPVLDLPAAGDHPGPLGLDAPGRFVHETELIVPAGWSARFGDGHVERKADAFRFSRDLDVDGSTVRLRYEFDLAKRRVEPAQVAAYLRELRAARDDTYVTLRFRRPVALAPGDREARLRSLLRDAMKGEE